MRKICKTTKDWNELRDHLAEVKKQLNKEIKKAYDEQDLQKKMRLIDQYSGYEEIDSLMQKWEDE